MNIPFLNTSYNTKLYNNELQDVLDKIIPEPYTSIFTDDSRDELIEYILYIINDYVEENSHMISDPDFDDIIYEDIYDVIYELYENYLDPYYYLTYNDTVELELNDIIDFTFDIFYICFIPERSINTKLSNEIILHDEAITNNPVNPDNPDNPDNPYIINNKNKDDITKIIAYLSSKLQPAQRTTEWYEYRHNLITASNAYKAFESSAVKNQLIYEKCQPIKVFTSDTQKQPNQVNINSTFHWGQKYEPVSMMMYEYLYNTKIGDFGCIKHDKYSFLGASPDGINIDPNSEKYGIMLEIKNIVNREITGIPKKEYWVQTQLQMETCGLDECDFLETRFIEYENEEAFLMDTYTQNSNSGNDHIEKTAKNEYKGIIMYFANKEGNPHYVYKPMNIRTYSDFQKWEEEQMTEYESKEYTWIKNLYWRLDCLSCVLIKRNIKWFNENVHCLEDIWKTIEYERIHGYEHRAPKSNKKPAKNFVENNANNSKCLLHINIDTGDVKLDIESNNSYNNSIHLSNKVDSISDNTLTAATNTNIQHFFKIRTQSFDESKKMVEHIDP